MSRKVTVRATSDPKKKERVSKILSRLRINRSEAINIYYSLIEEYKGLPFDLKLPESKSRSQNINPEMVQYLKESVKKNCKLGELFNLYLR